MHQKGRVQDVVQRRQNGDAHRVRHQLNLRRDLSDGGQRAETAEDDCQGTETGSTLKCEKKIRHLEEKHTLAFLVLDKL